MPSIGGLERVVNLLASSLLEKGCDVFVISTNTKNNEFIVENSEGIKVFLFPFLKAMADSDLALMKKVTLHVNELLEEISPDIINIHGWLETFSFYQYRVLDKKSRPACMTVHGLLEQENYETTLCSKLLSKMKKINVVSNSVKKELLEKKLDHGIDVKVIYNGVRENVASKKNEKPYSLLMVGRLSKEKNFEMIFHVMAKLIRRHPNVKLTLLGNGILYGELKKLRRELGLDEYVMMPGFISFEEVNKAMAEACILIVPSSYESFGLVALEAAMAETPVVASRIGGLQEVVEHEKTGLLVELNHVDGFVGAIDLLLSDPKKRRKMGRYARERARRLFSLESSVNHYMAMYKEAIES